MSMYSENSTVMGVSKEYEFVIKREELIRILDVPEVEFEKYVSPLINLANNFAQATRPRAVGQMSELIKEFQRAYPEEEWTFDNWKNFYLSKEVVPGVTGKDAIDMAVKRIEQKIEEMRRALDGVDEVAIREWVEDLVLAKTFWGLMIQRPILSKLAELFSGDSANYRLSTPEEEAKGIDGFIMIRGEEFPVSIKGVSYKQERHLGERIDAPIVYYKKTKSGLRVDYSEFAEWIASR